MRSGQFRAGATINEGSTDFEFVTLADLLPYAYRLKSFQVIAPQSLREARWNIRARLPQGGSRDQIPEMMQAMLVHRFKLEIHREKRDLPVYELVLSKDGPKLKPSESDDPADDIIAAPGPPGGGPPGGPGPGNGPLLAQSVSAAIEKFPERMLRTLKKPLHPAAVYTPTFPSTPAFRISPHERLYSGRTNIF